jgi:hypothetical protein
MISCPHSQRKVKITAAGSAVDEWTRVNYLKVSAGGNGRCRTCFGQEMQDEDD